MTGYENLSRGELYARVEDAIGRNQCDPRLFRELLNRWEHAEDTLHTFISDRDRADEANDDARGERFQSLL